MCLFQLIRQILPSMMKHNHGHIITILGSTAVFGLGNFSDICTAKFGLVGLMESVDHELTLGKRGSFS
jgi:NAD(P)-dependent dehydrogenase (short-subunit alcohol dehydrogenase family)